MDEILPLFYDLLAVNIISSSLAGRVQSLTNKENSPPGRSLPTPALDANLVGFKSQEQNKL